MAAPPPTANVRATGRGQPVTPPTAQRTAGRPTGGAARTRAAFAEPGGKVGQVSGGGGPMGLIGSLSSNLIVDEEDPIRK